VSAAKKASTAALEALIEAHAVELKLPTVKRRFKVMAEEATREQQSDAAYLGALLEAEVAERAERRERRRLVEARFPVMKSLEEFRFEGNPRIPQATIAALAEGSWISDRESVIFAKAVVDRLRREKWGGILVSPNGVWKVLDHKPARMVPVWCPLDLGRTSRKAENPRCSGGFP
jgi:hypothetical protein